MSDIPQGFQNVDAFGADGVADWWHRLAAAAEAGHFLDGFPDVRGVGAIITKGETRWAKVFQHERSAG